jgi:hypothetical protein
MKTQVSVPLGRRYENPHLVLHEDSSATVVCTERIHRAGVQVVSTSKAVWVTSSPWFTCSSSISQVPHRFVDTTVRTVFIRYDCLHCRCKPIAKSNPKPKGSRKSMLLLYTPDVQDLAMLSTSILLSLTFFFSHATSQGGVIIPPSPDDVINSAMAVDALPYRAKVGWAFDQYSKGQGVCLVLDSFTDHE